jgi:1-phosphofructokinase family hexose kinase
MIYTLTLNPAVDRELTVPAIEYDTVLRAAEWRVDVGGKGFNVSRMLMSLGMTSTALAFAGGRSGEMLCDGLEALNISTDFVWVEGDTRTNVSIVTANHDRYIKVNEPGPTVSAEDQTALLEKISGLARPDDWWVLSGSLPPGVATTFYAEVIKIIQTAGGHAILDSSGAALRHGCKASPFLAKPNDAEAQALTGLPVESLAQIIEVAAAVRSLGPTNVVISLGKKGAVFSDGSEVWLAASPTIVEANPIGAGDSMVGGLVWGLSQGQVLGEAMRWALACGSATASQPGTTVGSREMVETLTSQVQITSI